MSRCTCVERLAEVVGVGERRAAGVRGQRLQRLLLRRELRELLRHAAAREGADAAAAALAALPPGTTACRPRESTG